MYQFVVWQLHITEDATKLTPVVTPPKYWWKLTISSFRNRNAVLQ